MKVALIVTLAWGVVPGIVDAGELPSVVATVGGDSITTSELSQAIGASLFTLETEAYNQKVKILNQLIDQRLERDEAAARKVTVEALEKAEIEDKVAPVADADVNATYERVKARFPGKSEGEIKALISADFVRRNEQLRRNEFLRGLRSKTSSRILLDPPRLEVADGGGPSKGPKDAPVTIDRVLGFPVPLLRPGGARREAAGGHVRRQPQARLPQLPAVDPPTGPEGGRGRGLRPGPGQVLGDARHGSSPTRRSCRSPTSRRRAPRSAWIPRPSRSASTRASTRPRWRADQKEAERLRRLGDALRSSSTAAS